MPLLVEPLISSLTTTMGKMNPSPAIFANEFTTALEAYIRPILNMTGGNFIEWLTPRMQIMNISSVLNPSSNIYGMQLGRIIEVSFSTIQTRNQLGPVQIPEGILPSQFLGFFSALNPSSSILAAQLGKAIHVFARGSVITSVDMFTGTPVTGPIQ